MARWVHQQLHIISKFALKSIGTHSIILVLALWLLPQNSTYGEWPRSGEIDLLESRGNRLYTDHENQPIGVEHFGSTLHFGPRWDQSAWSTSTFGTKSEPGKGFDCDFHKYKLEWTPQHIRFYLDGKQVGSIPVDDGFWKRGKFNGESIWSSGTLMAPFDQEVIDSTSMVDSIWRQINIHQPAININLFGSLIIFWFLCS